MKTALLEIESLLSSATAELSMPNPNAEKAKRGIEVARRKVVDLAESQSGRDPLYDAKRKLASFISERRRINSPTRTPRFFSLLSKRRALKDEIERAQKNN